MEQTKILLIDDCEICRRGIAKLLDEQAQIVVKGDFQFAGNAIEFLKTEKIDVVIIDTNIADMDEKEVVAKIKFLHPESGVLIFSPETDVEYLVSLAKAGVSSYLRKTTPLAQLIHTIQNIKHGEIYFSQKIACVLSDHLMYQSASPLPQHYPQAPITPREMEVLKLIAAEYSNKEIAKKLYISPRTVDIHRRNLFLKLEVNKTAGLVNYYHSLNGMEILLEKPS